MKGWSKRAILQFPLAWAKSTRKQYNAMIAKFQNFCAKRGHKFPPLHPGVIADFYCELADNSIRPESVLKCASAALSWLYKAFGLICPTQDVDIRQLVSALVKSGTQTSRTRSKVMPIEPFASLFRGWEANSDLPLADLRLKAITLLALSVMLRPSDIAPNGEHFNPETDSVEPFTFSTEDITRNTDGSVGIKFHGIKNDYDRQGFAVNLQPADQVFMDPVGTLDVYVQRSQQYRVDIPGSPVFITLNKPYHQLSSQGVAQVLNKSIKLAGLDHQGFSARSFRPTGATVAIDNSHNPDTVMKIGRWKSREIFMTHYVHSKTPSSFCTDLFNHA